MQYNILETPIGPLLLAGKRHGDQETVRIVGFPKGKGRVEPGDDWREDLAAFSEARRELTEYFNGERTEFSFPLDPVGTDFQLQVWKALADIPYGTTISYREMAEKIGRPTATRAVGAANGRNPLPIVLPCHRVVGADGSLTGFGGGLPIKRFLLELEGAPIVSQERLAL